MLSWAGAGGQEGDHWGRIEAQHGDGIGVKGVEAWDTEWGDPLRAVKVLGKEMKLKTLFEEGGTGWDPKQRLPPVSAGGNIKAPRRAQRPGLGMVEQAQDEMGCP